MEWSVENIVTRDGAQADRKKTSFVAMLNTKIKLLVFLFSPPTRQELFTSSTVAGASETTVRVCLIVMFYNKGL